jgi:hypothetical protein
MLSAILCAAVLSSRAPSVWALNGENPQIIPRSGWASFEVITEGDDVPGDGNDYSMPGAYDGTGAFLLNGDTLLRMLVNHEKGDASISEVDIDVGILKEAIINVIGSDETQGVSFVVAARQAYDHWSRDGGSTWIDTSSTAETKFYDLCSGQSYEPNTFGSGRGFVDHLYITGEEVAGGRLFALDLANRDLYQLSGVAGSASGDIGGWGGMPYDSWENAALVDTREANYIALLLAPDGGTELMQIYIGEKGKDFYGNDDKTTFLARNGLAYGSYYYLTGTFPSNAGSTNAGTFERSWEKALSSTKMEDIDTSPSDPTKVVLGDENSGMFVFDFNLVFSPEFHAESSNFTVTKITSDDSNSLNNADNVDWTASSNVYPDGLIFVNEDNCGGEIWKMNPDGSNKVRIGFTKQATESAGIIDVSEFLGYPPASILICNSHGPSSSMSVLISSDVNEGGQALTPTCQGSGAPCSTDADCCSFSCQSCSCKRDTPEMK